MKMFLHFESGRTLAVESTARDAEDRERISNWRRENLPDGTRVRLVALAQNPGGFDDRPHLPPGSTGTVTGEPDGGGSLPVHWDHGSNLQATVDDIVVLYGDQT